MTADPIGRNCGAGEDNAAVSVSVVVPFLNRVGSVQPCLDRIVAEMQSLVGINGELIAVDNGSTDGTREKLAEFATCVVDCKVRGPAAARNAGIRAARGKIIALTDSDCMVQPGWLAALIAPFFEDPDVLITGGAIRTAHVRYGVTMYMDQYRILDNEKFFEGVLCYPPFFATANAAFRRSVFLQTGGFDETLRTGEDSDLCWRMMDAGGRMVYCPEAVIEHAHRESCYGFFRQAVEYGVGAATVFAKHRRRFGIRGMIEWHNFRMMAILPFSIPLHLLDRHPYERKMRIYDSLWRTGFLLGKIRGSLRNRVLFI